MNKTYYRSLIDSLMDLTASRSDIMFLFCLCACYQSNPKESHLQAIKRIFCYLKGKTTLRVWYPKEEILICTLKCCSQVLRCHNQLLDYEFNFLEPPMYIDHIDSMFITSNRVQHSKTKHIKIRYQFLRGNSKKGLIV